MTTPLRSRPFRFAAGLPLTAAVLAAALASCGRTDRGAPPSAETGRPPDSTTATNSEDDGSAPGSRTTPPADGTATDGTPRPDPGDAADPRSAAGDDDGKGLERVWHVRGEGEAYGPVVRIGQDRVRLKYETLAVEKLEPGDQQFVKHWSVPAKRPALRKFCEIGTVTCDDDGGIRLELEDSDCTDAVLRLAASLPETVILKVNDAPVGDDGLQVLSKLPNLRELRLEYTEAKGPGLAHLAELAQLESFAYLSQGRDDASDVLDAHLKPLGGLSRLKRLEFQNCRLGADALRTIGGLTKLERLRLSGTEYPEENLQDLRNLTALRELDLGYVPLTDENIGHLAGLTELRELQFDGRLTQVGLRQFGRFAKLEKLEVPMQLDDEGLAALAPLVRLRTLFLYGDGITDSGLRHLAAMRDMEELTLPAKTTAAGLEHLAGMKRLRHLQFTGYGLTMSEAVGFVADRQGRTLTDALRIVFGPGVVDEDGMAGGLDLTGPPKADRGILKYVRRMTDMYRLSLGPETTDEWLADLAPLKELSSLSFQGDREGEKTIGLSAAGTKHVGGMRSLRRLSFHGCDLSAGALAPLAGLRELEQLSLDDCRIAEGDFEAVGRLTGLESLDLGATPTTDAALRHLAGLKDLEHLVLPETVTLDGIRQLKGLGKLKSLYVDWSKYKFAEVVRLLTDDFGRTPQAAIALCLNAHEDDGSVVELYWPNGFETTDADLDFVVRHLPDLEEVHLPASITDAGLAHVARLRRLRRLGLTQSRVTDRGLGQLKGLSGLEALWLSSDGVTDAGVEHLAAMKGLKEISLYGTKVTEAGVARLRQALPEARIEH